MPLASTTEDCSVANHYGEYMYTVLQNIMANDNSIIAMCSTIINNNVNIQILLIFNSLYLACGYKS